MGSAIGGELMKNCREWQETLWLDVHGELSLQMRLDWEKHIEECKSCYQERTELLHLLKNVNEAVPEMSLSNEDASTLYQNITGKLKKDHHAKARWREWFFDGYIKPVHALAACCLLIVAFGWFGLKGLKKTTRIKIFSDPGTKEQLIATDMDLLKNLELLEEMDTLEKLDKVMGQGETKI